MLELKFTKRMAFYPHQKNEIKNFVFLKNKQNETKKFRFLVLI